MTREACLTRLRVLRDIVIASESCGPDEFWKRDIAWGAWRTGVRNFHENQRLGWPEEAKAA